MPITNERFTQIAKLVRDKAAIVLETGKEYLVETRLSALARQEGIDSLENLFQMLEQDTVFNTLQVKVIDALTTNETSFYRDHHPFEAMRKDILPRLIKERGGKRELRIWSAACSTGQEPYSLAMMLLQHFPELTGWNVKIIGTDLSLRVLEQAKSGIYNQVEVNRGLPAPLLIKHFEKVPTGWRLRDSVRKLVEFRELNLLKPWLFRERFDIVLIRNVLIYFDVATKQQLLGRIREVLQPDGYLFLGSAETTFNISNHYTPERFGNASAYRLVDNRSS